LQRVAQITVDIRRSRLQAQGFTVAFNGGIQCAAGFLGYAEIAPSLWIRRPQA
jgi:hypothetical protein